MNIIEELYHGNIRLNEQQFDQDSHYADFIKTIADNEDILTKYLAALPAPQ